MMSVHIDENDGRYLADGLGPGNYALSVVPSVGRELFSTSIALEAGKTRMRTTSASIDRIRARHNRGNADCPVRVRIEECPFRNVPFRFMAVELMAVACDLPDWRVPAAA